MHNKTSVTPNSNIHPAPSNWGSNVRPGSGDPSRFFLGQLEGPKDDKHLGCLTIGTPPLKSGLFCFLLKPSKKALQNSPRKARLKLKTHCVAECELPIPDSLACFWHEARNLCFKFSLKARGRRHGWRSCINMYAVVRLALDL